MRKKTGGGPETAAERKKWFCSEEFKEKFLYDGKDLGAVPGKDGTWFRVWAPAAENVSLNLYSYGSSREAALAQTADRIRTIPMERGVKGTWQVKADGVTEGLYYTYSVTTDGETRETQDPYARACGVNGERSMVADLKRTDPEGWAQDQMPEESRRHPVIWELHIKDFSYDVHSGVKEQWHGKYLAFTQEGTTLDGAGDFPTCLEYLKNLGVTYVHLLPAFDYGSVDESRDDAKQYNWGYDPVNYNVPEGSYATDACDGYVRIREFKEMVKALHQAGIGVIMDVVFNHTYSLDCCLQKTAPDYYFRMYEDGTRANGSACGNDTASEREMFRKYMADSVCYWAQEYHIDGFRFDLMGLHDVETMNTIRRELNALPGGDKILMYGEPWAADRTAMEQGARAATAVNIRYLDEHVAMFSDRIRDAVKGSVFYADRKGYVNGSSADAMKQKALIMRSVCALCGIPGAEEKEKIRAKAPSQIINYVSAHDDWTLWDKLVLTDAKKEPVREELLQKNKMAAGIVFTCLGTPFFQAGEEFGRTKDGCDNSYNCSPELNQLDWRRAEAYQELTAYYRFLIALRREIPALECREAEGVRAVAFEELESAVTGFVVTDESPEAKWRRTAVYYNPYEEEKEVLLPEGSWRLLSDGAKRHSLKGLEQAGGRISLKARSVTILKED